MPEPIPIVLCGASAQIATGVKNGLLPEIEVIHVILSAEAGASEIPLLLDGQTLSASENVGSQNYSKKPVAVVTGGGYDDIKFKLMKDALDGKGSVSWLRPDMGYPMPPLGPQYGAIMVERVKKAIKELVDNVYPFGHFIQNFESELFSYLLLRPMPPAEALALCP